MQIFAQQYQQRVPSLQPLGVVGGYGLGPVAFGSNLDLIVAVTEVIGRQVELLQRWPLAELPLGLMHWCSRRLNKTTPEQRILLGDGAQARPALASLTLRRV